MAMDNFTIREYLNSNFSNFKVNDLVSHFLLEFGVNVSNEDDLYLFKYNQISANWEKEITYECRGIILRHSATGWEYVSIPFKKFFNLEEGKCPWFEPEEFSKIVDKIVFAEKIDGSCIQVWYDNVKCIWRASTLGSISTANVFDHPFTFSDLFWRIYLEKGNTLSPLTVGYTYIFELWSGYNQVVTQYSENTLVLLGIRNIKTFSINDFKVEDFVSQLSNIKAPLMFKVDDIKTKNDVEIWVEKMALREDLFGKTPEGFVAWFEGLPIFKKKNEKYCQFHRIVTGDKIYVLKNIISAVFSGNIDDIYGELNPELQAFVDRLKVQLSMTQLSVLGILSQLRGIPLDDKKAFALKLKEISTTNLTCSMFEPFFFYNRIQILNGEHVDILSWLAEDDRYTKTLDKWKAV